MPIYRPCDQAQNEPMPYGGSQPEWPYGTASTALVFSDDGSGCWGFFDPDWTEDGVAHGQFRINIASPTGAGETGGDHQTLTLWAKADDWNEIVGRVQDALRFARQEGARQERVRIIQQLQDLMERDKSI